MKAGDIAATERVLKMLKPESRENVAFHTLLAQISMAKGDTQADPKSAELRNEHAFYSLLAHSEDGDPHGEAKKIFTENPGNAGIAITRALSLCQQGKVADAVAISGGLPAAELKKPKAAFYHAISLTAAGESAKATAAPPPVR